MQRDKLICCIDFELTDRYEPLEFGCVRVNTQGEVVDYWETMFAVKGKPILPHQRFEKQGTKTIEQLWNKIDKLLTGNYLAAHNVGTDRSVLVKHFPFIELAGEIDTLQIYRKLYSNSVADFSLGALLTIFEQDKLISSLNWNDHFVAHRALFDAAGCAFLLARLLKDDKLKEIFNQPIQGELF